MNKRGKLDRSQWSSFINAYVRTRMIFNNLPLGILSAKNKYNENNAFHIMDSALVDQMRKVFIWSKTTSVYMPLVFLDMARSEWLITGLLNKNRLKSATHDRLAKYWNESRATTWRTMSLNSYLVQLEEYFSNLIQDPSMFRPRGPRDPTKLGASLKFGDCHSIIDFFIVTSLNNIGEKCGLLADKNRAILINSSRDYPRLPSFYHCELLTLYFLMTAQNVEQRFRHLVLVENSSLLTAVSNIEASDERIIMIQEAIFKNNWSLHACSPKVISKLKLSIKHNTYRGELSETVVDSRIMNDVIWMHHVDIVIRQALRDEYNYSGKGYAPTTCQDLTRDRNCWTKVNPSVVSSSALLGLTGTLRFDGEYHRSSGCVRLCNECQQLDTMVHRLRDCTLYARGRGNIFQDEGSFKRLLQSEFTQSRVFAFISACSSGYHSTVLH